MGSVDTIVMIFKMKSTYPLVSTSKNLNIIEFQKGIMTIYHNASNNITYRLEYDRKQVNALMQLKQ